MAAMPPRVLNFEVPQAAGVADVGGTVRFKYPGGALAELQVPAGVAAGSFLNIRVQVKHVQQRR
jgi:hypothetical protein